MKRSEGGKEEKIMRSRLSHFPDHGRAAAVQVYGKAKTSKG